MHHCAPCFSWASQAAAPLAATTCTCARATLQTAVQTGPSAMVRKNWMVSSMRACVLLPAAAPIRRERVVLAAALHVASDFKPRVSTLSNPCPTGLTESNGSTHNGSNSRNGPDASD